MRKPKAVIDLSGVQELKGVRSTADGIEIGAMTTLTTWRTTRSFSRSTRPRRGGRSGGVTADPQPGHHRRERLAGRSLLVLPAGWPCYRAGGNICYADTPTGATGSTPFSTRSGAWR
jgi:xanthine dehydrogenase YagS FAD-binding subunit